MKKLVSVLCVFTVFILSCGNSFAGLPPTSVQGQSDITPQVKFNFQVPYSQKTDLGGIKALFETGNKDLLVNPSFENTIFSTGWTTTKSSGTTFTSAVETTNILDGKQSTALTVTSAVGLISQDITPSIQTNGVNMEASCWVKTSLADVQVCPRTGGTNGQCQTVPGTNQWVQVVTNFPGPSNGTSVGVAVQNQNSESGTIYVDDCYVGQARYIGTIAQAQYLGSIKWSPAASCSWLNTTSTFTTPTANASCNSPTVTGSISAPGTKIPEADILNAGPGEYMIVGTGGFFQNGSASSSAQFRFYEATTGTGLEAQMMGQTGSLASNFLSPTINGHFTNSTSQTLKFQFQALISNSGSSSAGVELDSASTNGVYNQPFEIRVYYFPAKSNVIQTVDQSDFGFSSCDTLTIGATTTPPTKGTVSVDQCRYKRDGDTMEFKYTLAQTGAGSAGSGDYLIPVPNGLSIDSTKVTFSTSGNGAGGSDSGHVFFANTTSSGGATGVGGTIVPYDATHLRAIVVSGSNTVTPWGSTWFALNNATIYATITARIPISTWANTNRAPNLIGSVTSSASSQSFHVESAFISNPAGTCSVTSQTGSWVSIGASTTGKCTLNFSAGEWSSAPSCVCSASGFSVVCGDTGAPTTSSVQIQTGAPTNSNFEIICMGPR